MEEIWINIEGKSISLKETPQLLLNLDLMPIFLRRYFENKYTADIEPNREEQIIFQKEFMQKEKITNKETLEKWLNFNGVTETEINKKLYNSLQLEKFKSQQFDSKIESVFLERKSKLDKVTYSLIRVKSRAKAAELHVRLKEEEATFPELSSTYSEGVEKVLHGLIGPIEFGNINSEIAEILRNSSPGQLWPPFELEGWWVILRHERFLPASLNPAMRKRLINEMYEVWIKGKIINTMNQLRESMSIKEESMPIKEESTPIKEGKKNFFSFFDRGKS